MNELFLTDKDYQRLHTLVKAQQSTRNDNLDALCQKLKNARQVPSEEIPTDVVTMNSFVRLKELTSKAVMELTLSYPKDADLTSRKISVLAPVGTAILGAKLGDIVEWSAAKGSVAYKVEEILFQPEAAGEFYL